LTITIPPVPRVVAHVRNMPGDFFLRAEVADALAVSPATLRRLALTDTMTLGPSAMVTYGTLLVPAYNAAAIARLHAYLAAHRSARGRPRLWTDTERRARRAAHSAAGYRRRRAAALRDRGDQAEAEQMLRDADRLRSTLRYAHQERSAASHRSGTARATCSSDVPRARH
jgi:hypothetical protein